MRRHDLDVFSLVAGLVFLALAIGHLVDESSSVSLDGRWVAPLTLIALGAAGLASALRRSEPTPATVAAHESVPVADQPAQPLDSDETAVVDLG